MDKVTILNLLTTSGEIQTFRRTKNWEDAFKLYNAANRERLDLNCTRCFKKVEAWLKT